MTFLDIKRIIADTSAVPLPTGVSGKWDGRPWQRERRPWWSERRFPLFELVIRSRTSFLSLLALTAATIPSLTSSQREETLQLTFHARHLFLHSFTLPIFTFRFNSLRRFHSSAGGPFSFPSAGRAGCRFVPAPGREGPFVEKALGWN